MNEKSNINLIALLTDFGTKDYFVGAMKGVILSINPSVKIVDLTHEIEPQNISAASFTLRACCRNFPRGTVFVAVVDPGVGSDRKAILVETGEYFFIAPDNGLLSFIFNENNRYTVYELTNGDFFAGKISATFHGRDVFAPAAAHLAKGVAPRLFGAETKSYIHLKELRPKRISAVKIEAEIIHADHFGNLITNLKSEDLPEKFTLEINGTIIGKRLNFFAEAVKSELFTIVGSANLLEIVAFQDSARRLLKAEVGCRITVVNS